MEHQFLEKPRLWPVKPHCPFSKADIFDAVARWDRFAPYIEAAFPETAQMHAVIESPLIELTKMRSAWNEKHDTALVGAFIKG